MNPNHFNTKFTVALPPETVAERISDVAGWWATNVTGSTQKTGDVFTVRFGKTYSVFTITEIMPSKKIVWLVTDCDLPLFANRTEWKNTKIVWEISTQDNLTTVSMTHVGLTPDASCYIDCEKGWTFYVQESLQKLMVEGKGLPGTGIFSYIFVGPRKYEGLLYFKNAPLPDYLDGFLVIDVMDTTGEQVTAIYSAGEYQKDSFNTTRLKGEYFMIIENCPGQNNTSPLKDILTTLKHAVQ
jgi:hypothetical protein